MSSRQIAEIPNVAASIAKAVPGPNAATSRPPIAGPTSCAPSGRISMSSEFAWTRCSVGTMSGTMAWKAGAKSASPAP
jgi:hypothetical protein